MSGDSPPRPRAIAEGAEREPTSAGARFRAAAAAERPLQVPGAICAYHAFLAP